MTALELAFIRRTLFNNIASAELPFMGNENYLPQQTPPTNRHPIGQNCKPEGKIMNANPLLNVVLVSPEIPYNTGNIIRLCANVGANLHLVEPLGFILDNPHLRRASLDYSDLTSVKVHADLEQIFLLSSPERTFGAVSKGPILYTLPKYEKGDTIIFGRESLGLEHALIEKINQNNRVRIPMVQGNRSLNLSNAVAILVYELWRQLGFSDSLFEPKQENQYFA